MPRIITGNGSTRSLPYTVVKPQATTAKKQSKAEVGVKPKSAPYTYNKLLFLTLVLKQASPSWETIASAMNAKTKNKTYDTWRQILLPALTSGRPWSQSSGSAWSSAEKIKLVMMVIESIKIQWDKVGEAFPGRRKTQLYDVWRQNILPRLKKGEPSVV